MFWMVLIFGLVFFLLAKFGFPVITGMVNKRNDYIRDSLEDARVAREQLCKLQQSCDDMIAKTRIEQSEMLDKARESARAMVEQAKDDASKEAARLIARAREDIEQEKKDAFNTMANEIVNVAISVSEKILRRELKDKDAQDALISTMMDDINRRRSSENS